MELLERGRFHERPSLNQADEHRGDLSQPTHDQLCSPSVNNDATMNVAQNVVGVQGMEQGGEEEILCSHLDMDNSMENTGEGSVQHVDRIVSPWRHAIDENYSRRGATERLVQPGVGGSSSGVNMNHTAISTSPQEQNNEVYNLTGDGTSIQAPDMYEKSWVEIINSLMDDGIQNAIGVAQPGAGASSSGVLKYNTSETRGDPLSCAISASAQEHNNKVIHVEMAQGEPFFTGEIACDLFRGRTELVHNAPETRPLTEQASPETELPWGRNSPEELPHDAFETIPRTEHAPLLERGSSHDRQSINQVDEPRGDSSQQADLLCLGHARYDCQLCSPAVNNDAIMNDVQNMDRMRKEPVEKEEEDMDNNSGRSVQPGAGAGSSVGLKHNTSETRGAPLPIGSTKLVGRAFEENRKVIWSWLMDDEVSTIGIYGMGGAGKTTILKHIYNELLQSPDSSHHVYWVTVSRDFSIHTLQKKIAKCINLSLSTEEEELHIAAELSLELKKKQRWILILDDLWNSFEPDKVGIPDSLKGCKLIITTRSEAVCRQMNSKNNVRVNPLPKGEAWTLFTEILGHDTQLSLDVEQIAIFITRECDGLPLGIKTIAGTMKGVDDIHEWSDALEDLRQSRVMQDKVEEEVFKILRFSYTHLSDRALQRCFLYCALFPEDFEIPRENLIGFFFFFFFFFFFLRYLRTNGFGEKKFPSGILPKLFNLQVFIIEELIISDGRIGKEITVEGKEVGCLRMLENLECHFKDYSNYVEYLKSRDDTQSLKKYNILVGQFREDKLWEFKYHCGQGSKMVVLGDLNINRDGNFQFISLNDIQQLICQCIDARSLGDVLPLKYATELEVIRISSCHNMESLVSSSWFCSAPQPSPSYNGIFSGLKKFYCCGCNSMKKLFPLVLLPNLVNLEEIIVTHCEKIEEIIGGTRSNEEGVRGEEISITLDSNCQSYEF
nr:uncharacterized protein LOC118050627 [Populus alba]